MMTADAIAGLQQAVGTAPFQEGRKTKRKPNRGKVTLGGEEIQTLEGEGGSKVEPQEKGDPAVVLEQ